MAYVARSIIENGIKKCNCRPLLSILRFYSSPRNDKKEAEDDFDKPIKFSTSKAATWKAEYSFAGSNRPYDTPWYQPIVISLSLAVFMLYFFILREENDIDKKMTTSLYDHVDGLEEVQIRNAISYYKEHDKSYDTSNLEKRLSEILKIKNQRQTL